MNFDRIDWHDDHLVLGEWMFRLDDGRADRAEESFRFFKDRTLVDEYERFFTAHPVKARNVLEVGMWDGGSLAFWHQVLDPDTIVGVDLQRREDSAYFRRFAAAQTGVASYWGVDQADVPRVDEIIGRHFDGPLDLVFDDASHILTPSRITLEAVFPQLRPGGWYIVEDWAWLHWTDSLRPGVPNREAPTFLVQELVEAVGTTGSPISQLVVRRGFVALERSEVPWPGSLRVVRRPDLPRDGLRRVAGRARRALRAR